MAESTEYTGQKVVYFLDIRIPDADIHRVPIVKNLTIGSSDDVEISVEEFGLAPRHGIFRVHNDILSLHNLGGSGKSSIGTQSLQHGKMYIVDSGDKLSLGELEIFIRSEAIKSEKEFINLIGHARADEMEIDELMEEAADDDDEEEEKGPGLVARIKAFFKKKDKAPGTEQPPSKKSDPGERTQTARHSAPQISVKKKYFKGWSDAGTAGFIGRFFAFILNLLITMNLVLMVLPLSGQEKFVDDQITGIITLIGPHFDKLPGLVPAALSEYTQYLALLISPLFLKYLLIYLTLNLIGSFLLGASIGHSLLLITGDGSAVSKRIKALFRSLLGFVTAPLLLFDLPCLLGKRTFKEIASGSRLQYRNKIAKILGPLLLFPLFLIVVLALPLLEDIDHIAGLQTEESKNTFKKSKEEPAFKGSSTLLGLQLRADSFEDRTFIPQIKLEDGKPLYLLHLLDISSKAKATLQITPAVFEKAKLIESGTSTNPLSFHFYKNLVGPGSRESDNEKEASFKKLLENALSFHHEKLAEITPSNGPFIHGLVKLRHQLLNELKLDHVPKLEFRDSGSHRYLIFSNPQEGKVQNRSVYPLTGDSNLDLWKITFKKPAREAGADLDKMLLVGSKPLALEDQDLHQRLIKEKEWGPLDVLDFYAHLQNTQKSPDPKMETLFTNYYKFRGQLALSIGSDYLFEQTEMFFKSNLEVLEKMNEANPELELTNLIKTSKEHLNALSSKNIKYFEGRKKSVRKAPVKKSKKKTRLKRQRKAKRK